MSFNMHRLAAPNQLRASTVRGVLSPGGTGRGMSSIAIASRPAWWGRQRSCLYAAHVNLSSSTGVIEVPSSTGNRQNTTECEYLPSDLLMHAVEVGASMRLQRLLKSLPQIAQVQTLSLPCKNQLSGTCSLFAFSIRSLAKRRSDNLSILARKSVYLSLCHNLRPINCISCRVPS